MHAREIDIEPFANAVERLRDGLARYERDVSDAQIRDGLIQRFEFTYELSHRLLTRYLIAVTASAEEYRRMPFADLIRSGNERGLLLGDWPSWKTYRDLRARTCHTYHEPTALAVAAEIPAFLREAGFLRDRLRERIG